MFLFIPDFFINSPKLYHSNTSHVLIYLFAKRVSLSIYGIQIHLMFLFIACPFPISWGQKIVFKYISCSYLSDFDLVSMAEEILFKYISCSYLSKMTEKCVFGTLSFKYISCSYLSEIYGDSNKVLFDSNTSHVLIYQ